MTIKKYFEVAENIQSLANKSAADISSEVESVGYHEQDIIEEERFIPRIDFSKPENFARYGSAEEYYAQSIKRIYNTYPYDGSLKERLEWVNESTYLDIYLYDNKYPRTTGYIIMSADGAATDSIVDGYGRPSSPEYIYVKGGPNPHPEGTAPYNTQFTGSNYYEPSMNRASNLEMNLSSNGVSLEFWLKKDGFLDPSITSREVIFDLWNGELSSSNNYGRLRLELTGNLSDGSDPFLLTAMSGTSGSFRQSIAAATVTSASVADGNWHHYAVTMKSASAGVTTRFYVDGGLNNESTLGSTGINDLDSTTLRAYVGALITSVSGATTPSSTEAGDGKLSAALDEFRFWKTQRSSKEIGRHWFTQVGGGTNTDPQPFVETMGSGNVDLGIYFKFNEGITGVAATDKVVLDYSGRFSNGAWTVASVTNSRNTGSAIVSSSAAIKEFHDPIIYSFHPDVVALDESLQLSGSFHDVSNNASVYNSIPAWITEEDNEGQKQLLHLTQIMSSYFDTLQLQIESLNTLKDKQYPSGSNKPLPFAEKLLSSQGFVAPDLFLDADILEKLADRSEDRVYEKSLHDVKNIIYQNIYNNLSYIYKSKGTEKAFRNLIRCFGIDEELIKLNTYADNIEFELKNNRKNVVVADNFVNFNTADGAVGVVYNYADPTNINSVGAIPANIYLTGGYATTLEAEILFPLKMEQSARTFHNTNVVSASLFGIHNAPADTADTTWSAPDTLNFQVYAQRDEKASSNARFVLTSTAGGLITRLTSSLIQDLYNNNRWNLSVRIKPAEYPLRSLVVGTTDDYIVELHGVQADSGEILDEFTVSQTLTAPTEGFVTGSRRAYIGAHRQNFTGSVLETSDVKVNACRYWLDYVDDAALRGHILDTENHGALQPHLYAYEFNPSASFGDIQKIDTLVFNWEFLTNTGSNANGQFTVSDISSGSAALTRYGALGDILNKQYTASGSFFAASSTTAIDKDYVVSSKLNLPEHIESVDMIRVLNLADQEAFTSETRPQNYYFAFEKSMYQAISKEIINYFANLKDLHNLIGEPLEKYRIEYKQLKVIRQKFFETIGNNELDFDKFYEFYKWFDSSLSVMLAQLVPASADFADNIITVIENHILERPKYRRKFPFLKKEGTQDPSATIGPNDNPISINTSPDDYPAGTGLTSNEAFTRRQIGSSNPIPQREWRFFHAPAQESLPTPLVSGAAVPPEDRNLYWHRYREERINSDRTALLKSIQQTYNRRIGAPVRVTVEGQITFGGVGRHPSNRPNYTFAATAPYGPVIPSTNIPTNVMLSYGSDVEQLIDTKDVYFPTLKQRLGFGMDPGINSTPDEIKLDGNVYAPFSLYSSSVETGYNSKVVTQYKSGTMVTNLHNDFVQNHDVPMQGPFAEKFVGGRHYRHTEVNDGTDTRESRAEGFRLELGSLALPATGTLGVVPPNYPFGDSPPGSAPHGFLPELPTAQRFRDETAKRPQNIRNILMTTASVGTRLSGTIAHNKIGNYQKNYQVISTGGRTINDPFFQDQSFDFALNPQNPDPRTLILRRTPGQVIQTRNTIAATFEDTSGANSIYYSFTSPAAMSTNNTETWIFWIKIPDTSDYNRIFNSNFGRIGISDSFTDPCPGKLRFRVFDNGGTTDGVWNTSDDFPENEWTHVAITYDWNNLSNKPDIYINGIKQGIVTVSQPDAAPADYTGNGYFGYSSGVALNGFMSDIAFYNITLTAAEVLAIYNHSTVDLQNHSPERVKSNLIMWWRMGDGYRDSATSILDQMGNADLTKAGAGTADLVDLNFNDCFRTPRDFALPDRTGANSNQTVIVNHFSAPGDYKTLSRGYLDPAHEELSVYNASPYRNRAVINYGMSGSASVDPSIQNTIRVQDQLDKPRGLDQRATLHCGPFGTDAAYGSVTSTSTRVDGGLGYSETPSWQKTNRNRKRRMISGSSGYATGSVYDNLFVQHTIPQSEQQYSWITASLASGQSILGLDRAMCFSASTLSQLVTSSDQVAAAHATADSRFFGLGNRSNATAQGYTGFTPVAFNGLSDIVIDPVSTTSHTQGFESMTVDHYAPGTFLYRVNYINQDFIHQIYAGTYGVYTDPTIGNPGTAAVLNAILLNRNGPYGYPTWKQIRAGESPVARKLRETNQIGTVLAPKTIEDAFGVPVQPNFFEDYFEAPISKNASPIYFYFEDNTAESNPANNIVLTVPFRNALDYFSNNGLNNRLGLKIDLNRRRPYNSAVDFTISSSLTVIINYSERLYPSAQNAYKTAVRGRENYTIDNIWNNNRARRSELSGRKIFGDTFYNSGSMGQTIASASIWPLDAHLNFATTSSITASDGSGELMNMYSRWTKDRYGNGGVAVGSMLGDEQIELHAATTYASRIPAGVDASDNIVFAGDTLWMGAIESGKNPYQDYTTYAEKARLVAKDYSIIPEFRISELMEDYITTHGGNFLANIDNIFDLTGSSIPDSSTAAFYKTYTNADFLRYFGAIDDDLNDQRSGDLKIVRDKVVLKCDAVVKFLPYKGFYPAERTKELASLLSQSYSADLLYLERGKYSNTYGFDTNSQLRIFTEPLISPGILFNTIKSGLAVGNFVITQTGSSGVILSASFSAATMPYASQSAPCALPEGNIYYGKDGGDARILSIAAASSGSGNGYLIKKIPFEAIYRPTDYFNKSFLSQENTTPWQSAIFDTGISGSQNYMLTTFKDPDPLVAEVTDIQGLIQFNPSILAQRQAQKNGTLSQGSLYELAIDNFLCETTNFFMGNLANLQSSRGENFGPVVSGTVYTMKMDMFRTLSSSLNPANSFQMYNRISAFGTPLASAYREPGFTSTENVSFSHLTPAYFHSSGSTTFAYTASISGIPDLDEIFGNTNTYHTRTETHPNLNAADAVKMGTEDPRMYIDSSFNLFETLAEVPLDTTSQKKRWLIQSKFETPILNFAGSQMGASTLESDVATTATSSADEIVTRGMWHQYGTAITSSAAGIFINLSDSGPNSLADVVGFQKGIPRRLGVTRTELKLWEAIIAIPYHLGSGGPENAGRGGPNFIAATARVKASPTYQLLLNAMDKYVFPPRFDFTRFDTVDPILMYVFEFSAKLSQKDITDIWQNLPPDINEKFESKEAVVEEEQLLNLILDKDSDIHWMVFKVKKRAKKDFEITRRQLVQEDTSAMTPNIISEYSYNWPYDYFSLVELAKIDEQVQYVSRDLKPLPVITSTIGPAVADAPDEAETAPQPDNPGQ